MSEEPKWQMIGESDPGEELEPAAGEELEPAAGEELEPAAGEELEPAAGARASRGAVGAATAEITKITDQLKDPERVSVYLDDKFWLGMSRALLAELQLKPKQTLSASQRADIEKRAVEDKAYGWSLRRLGERAYSSAKIREKLSTKGYEPVVCESVVRKLVERGHLNDQEYAAALTRQHRESGYGKRRAEQKLRQAGIDPELIKDSISGGFASQDEDEAAYEALQKSKWRGRELTRPEQRKAMELLLRRGFSPPAAQTATARVAMDSAAEEAAMNTERALEELRRRYSRRPPESSKQVAYLARRGYRARVAYSAVAEFAEELSAEKSR